MKYLYGAVVYMSLFDPHLTKKLIKYLPQFIQEYKEIQAIMGIEQPYIETEWNDLTQAFSNNFMFLTNEYGVSLFERMMGISPKPTDTLIDRQQAVYIKWNSTRPYTWNWLLDFLEKYYRNSDTKATPILENDIYLLWIELSTNYMNEKDYELFKTLIKIIPANLGLSPKQTDHKNLNLYIGAYRTLFTVRERFQRTINHDKTEYYYAFRENIREVKRIEI